MKILLCDDDKFFLSLENSIICEIIAEDRSDLTVAGMAGSAREALKLAEECRDELLVFLDLDFGRDAPNGIDIGMALRQKAEKVRIVFTTNHREGAMGVLKSGVEPFGFLEKGADITALRDGFRKYLRMAQSAQRSARGGGATVTLTVGGEIAELPQDDIIYVETEKNVSHGITYRTQNGSKITVISTLDDEAKRLGDDFLRVHRSYLVSKSKILSLRNGQLILTDQSEIPCSIAMRAEVKKWLNRKK